MNTNRFSKGRIISIVISLLLILGYFAFVYWFDFSNKIDAPAVVLSFEDCVKAGYPIMESSPRQCRTPDGRIYAEEIMPSATYVNASSTHIVVDLPFPGAVTGKEFSVTGKARAWYFEGSFSIEVLDKDGKRLAWGIAQAQGDWMVDAFVPFKANIKVPDTYIGPATLVLHKDNPSDLREYDASMSFPFTIEY